MYIHEEISPPVPKKDTNPLLALLGGDEEDFKPQSIEKEEIKKPLGGDLLGDLLNKPVKKKPQMI